MLGSGVTSSLFHFIDMYNKNGHIVMNFGSCCALFVILAVFLCIFIDQSKKDN